MDRSQVTESFTDVTNYSTANQKTSKHKLMKGLGITERVVAFFANVAIVAGVLGLIFAYYQLQLSENQEKKRTAVEAVSEVRAPDFLKARTRLKTINDHPETPDIKKQLYKVKDEQEAENEFIDDINQVTNKYAHIALLYINNLADRCIVKDTCQTAIKEVCEFCINSTKCPEENKKNLGIALNLMEKEACK